MTQAERLVFTNRRAARRRAVWDALYRFWWVPPALLLALVWWDVCRWPL